MQVGDFLARGIWTEDRIEIEWRPELRRLTTPEIEANIEREWTRITTAQRGIYDGQLCRIAAYRASRDSISLTAAPTTYREYRGTNKIEIDDGYRANPLCVCAVVHTADGKLVLGQRSETSGESHRLWHVPGGHLESGKHVVGNRALPGLAMREELDEELGIPPGAIREMLCVGLSRPEDTLKPELLYYTRVDLEFAALRPNHEHSALEAVAATREGCLAFVSGRSMVMSGRACLEACASLLP